MAFIGKTLEHRQFRGQDFLNNGMIMGEILKECKYCKNTFNDECFNLNSNVCLKCVQVIKNDFLSKGKKFIISFKCDYCKKEGKSNLNAYCKAKHSFCSIECYWKHKKEYEPKGKNYRTYSQIECLCDQCGKATSVNKYHKEHRKNIFCSPSCYWEFRKINYSGENHNQYGLEKSEEQKNKMRQITIKRYISGDLNSRTQESKIQIKINSLLRESNIKNEREFICKYYAIDNYINEPNLAIEVMGDYFHASPLRYENKNINTMQKKALKRDKSKNSYLYRYYNMKVLYLWEANINKNIDLCKKLILLFIKKGGNLKNYHSFNYELKNGKIILKKDIIQTHY